jgi:hypothetical protein
MIVKMLLMEMIALILILFSVVALMIQAIIEGVMVFLNHPPYNHPPQRKRKKQGYYVE